ncbi:unnamed protein product [Paramecium sonneborni]|uniref:Uncharacterized protein n=1 Tax=Paramecium sonneborni TaxID=65129 RepID=A0A8S1MHB1_9CILI|nr:unnamed protein product [Paramecium sonneborni]
MVNFLILLIFSKIILSALVEYEGNDQKWKEISPSQITLDPPALTLINSPSPIQSNCPLIYQSSAKTLNFKININQGYIKINYVFELHLQTSSGTFTFSANTVILEKKDFIIDASALKYICLTSKDYQVNMNIQQIPTTDSNLVNFKMEYTHIATYYVTNFKVFIQICDDYCEHCDIQFQTCLTCKVNFVLELNKCVCKLTLNGGTCQNIPMGGLHFYQSDFQPYISKTQVFSDVNGQSYEFFADYNTTFRSKQIKIDGINIGGSFIQNEYIQFNINQVITTPSDFTIEFVIYWLGPLELFSNIEVNVDGLTLGRIMNFGTVDLIQFVQGSIYNRQICTVNGYSSCYRFNHIINLFQVDHLNTIQLKGHMNITNSKSAWAFSDFKISKIFWQTTTCTNFLYNNECKFTQCPSYAPLVGVNTCKDLLETYKFSQYLVKLFYDYGSTFFYNASSPFQKGFNSNIPQIYKEKFIFGGYQVWQTDYFEMVLQCNPHYKARLFVKLLLIDFGINNQNNANVYFDSIYKLYNWQNSVQVPGIDEKGDILIQDYLVTISTTDFEVNHNDQELLVSFNCNAFNSGYCALYDFFVLIALCPINCLRCSDSSTCLEMKQDWPILPIYYDCPYGKFLKQAQCRDCIKGCKVCSNSNTCDQCFDDYIYYNKQCFCNINGLSSGECSYNCHPMCQTCTYNISEDRKYDLRTFNRKWSGSLSCFTCDSSKGKVMNMESCECKEGFYLNEKYECLLCHGTCKNCLLSGQYCTECYVEQNRILESQKCKCQQGYFELSQSYTCIKCADQCKTCEFFETYCTSCFVSQKRSLKKNVCVCQLGHYQQNDNIICQECDGHCEYCSDYALCTSCYDIQYRQLQVDKCICQSGYYEGVSLVCQKCFQSCAECNNSNEFNKCSKCPKSRIRSNVYLNEFECLCKVGYYENNELECIDCSTYVYPPKTHYCYSQCGDSIIQWNEQCDDGNLEARDGCNQCQLSNNKCINEICLKCLLGDCQQCIDGYYLDNDFSCKICSAHCKTCIQSENKCVECKFQTDKKECITCIASAGYTIIDNECVTICGDGIRTTQEQCDDGNSDNGDGCSSYCTVEDGYICNQICIKIDYVDIILTPSKFDQIYSSSRIIQLTFDQPVNITKTPLKDSITLITPIQNCLFVLDEIKDTTSYIEEFNLVSISIQIHLNQTHNTPQITVIIKNDTDVISKDNFSFKSRNQTITLLQYQSPSDSEISSTENLIKFNSYILYLLIGFAILAFLFGGLDIFWNLLDTLQILSYLKYLNVAYPYNLDAYFQLFGFAEFDFLKSNFSIEDLLSSSIEVQDPALKFKQEGYTSVFLINIISIFIVIATTIATYILFHIIFYCIYHYANSITTQQQSIHNNQSSDEPNVILFLCFKLTRNMQKYFYNLKIQYKTAILRTFLTISYDLNLAIFLQLIAYTTTSLILGLSSLLALLFLLLQAFFIYFAIIIMSNKPFYFQLTEAQLKYGALYEGIVLDRNPFSLYYNIILFTKKLLFMFCLVFMYDYPLFQIGFVSLLNASFFSYIIYNKPFIDKSEYYKQIITEILLWLALLFILLIGFAQQSDSFTYQTYIKIAWIIITILTLLIFIQLIIDIRQHIIFLLEKYEILRILVNKIKSLHIAIFSRQQSISHDESQSLVGSSSRARLKHNNSKNTLNHQISQKQVRKLVTFRINDSIF